MKILFIANSFGEDTTRYLHGIARADGKNWKVVNLYIGGCSLYRHYRNMLSGEAAYEFQINGHKSGIMVSLTQALLSDEWDVVVTQQCSPQSGDESSYEPFATALAEFVRIHAPKAKFYIQQTWTFETDAPRFKLTSFTNPADMIEAIKHCYEQMAKNTRAWGIIPNGEVMYKLWQEKANYGIEAVHRDGFHAHKGIGRYLLALNVYATLSGRDISENSFSDFDEEVTPEAAAAARAIVSEISAKYREINKEYAKEAY